jgi:hypothetical protein
MFGTNFYVAYVNGQLRSIPGTWVGLGDPEMHYCPARQPAPSLST